MGFNLGLEIFGGVIFVYCRPDFERLPCSEILTVPVRKALLPDSCISKFTIHVHASYS